MRFYLSGAMRGNPGHNYALFEQIATELRAQDYDILSPHELHTQGTDRVKCMTDDVQAVLSCNGVFCIPGWESSPGACVEVAVAWAADLPVYLLEKDESGEWQILNLPAWSVTIPREHQWYDRVPLVGLCGFAQSGKDTVAGHFVKGHDWSRVAFADCLRDMLWELNPIIDFVDFGTIEEHKYQSFRVAEMVGEFGWDTAKVAMPEVRELLQRLGTEAGRDILGQNIWVRLAEEKIEQASPQPVVVSDCRFPNEIAMIRRRGGTLVWVDRPGVGAVNSHASEHSVGPADCDVAITNDSDLDGLYMMVDLFVTNLGWDPASRHDVTVPRSVMA